MNNEELHHLLKSLIHDCAKRHETEWIEFKHNNANPEEIGEYISALANTCTLHGKTFGYIVWGIEDKSHKILGTSFRPREMKVGNEELENWLLRKLNPDVHFQIHEWDEGDAHIVLIKIQPAIHTPVRFDESEFIRVGTYKKKLKDYPEKERALWAIFSKTTFEKGSATPLVSPDQVLALLDYPAYFDLTSQSLPENRNAIFERLIAEKILVGEGDKFFITNLGAILFAKNITNFESLVRKSCRVIVYKDRDRINTLREWPSEKISPKGYANGFSDIINFINTQLPQNEDLSKALRREVRMYPELAIRELVANALIHQDFSMTGTGPMVEIFADRIEITNPGIPLIDTMRFIDAPPQSRNDVLASFMRRIKICEERGSGIDKVIFECEFYQLPAPKFEKTDHHTKVTLYAPMKLSEIGKEDRIRACYLHACLKYVSHDRMTNETLRARFAIDKKNYPMAWRIIRDTQDADLIHRDDPKNKSNKDAKYVPFWA